MGEYQLHTSSHHEVPKVPMLKHSFLPVATVFLIAAVYSGANPTEASAQCVYCETLGTAHDCSVDEGPTHNCFHNGEFENPVAGTCKQHNPIE